MGWRVMLVGLVLTITGCGGSSGSANDDASEATPKLDEVIPVCSADPWQRFQESGIDAAPRDSEAYVVPSSSRRSLIQKALEDFRQTNYDAALANARAGAYELCRLDSGRGPVVFWHPASAGQGHARWALRINAKARPLAVEAPHGLFEAGTLAQAVELFQNLDAQAILVNGSHRCANRTASGCDGTTSVCGGTSEPFRESDMAHSVATYFQVAHRGIVAQFPQARVLNLHGMSREGISLSNGTRDDTAASSFVARLHGALAEQFPDRAVTTCNGYASTAATNHLCGTTNVQGRQRNGAVDACMQPAETASGQFLHLEQDRKIRTSESSRQRVLSALDAVLPAAGPGT